MNARQAQDLLMLQGRRRVVTRYDRCPTVLCSAIALAAAVIFWL